MKTRKLGKNGPEVSAIGLGLMGMSDFYGGGDDAESVRVIRAALDAGITLLDTGDFYGMGHNELLLGKALAEGGSAAREKAFIQVKFGAQRDPHGAFIGFDGRPAAVKTALAYTLKRLGTDYVDLYQPARVDPAVPIEETLGAVAELVKAGFVRYAGLSEAGADTIRRAHAVQPLVGLQREYSLVSRDIEGEISTTLAELGMGLTAYGVLSRGLLSGAIRSASDLAERDYRRHLPRFTGDNLERNLKLVDRLCAAAEQRGVTPSQLAIAWVLGRGDNIVPLIGTRSEKRLNEAVDAVDIELGDDELRQLADAVPEDAIAGARYDEHGMRLIDG